MRFMGIVLGVVLGIVVTGTLFALRPAEGATVMQSTQPIVVYYVDASGTPVLPPRTMPLSQYVEGGDRAVSDELHDFEYAFEADLHAKDRTFHRTHEFIDRRTW